MVRELTAERKACTMLRLLGILSLGHLFSGGRRHHHLRRGILFGVLLGYLANRDFDADRVAEDVRHENINYLQAIKRVIGMSDKPLANE